MSNQPNQEGSSWKERELGIFWKTESKNSGMKYLKGKVTLPGSTEPIKVVLFPVKDKKGDTSPDYILYTSEDSAGGGGGNQGGGYQQKPRYQPRANSGYNRGGGGARQPYNNQQRQAPAPTQPSAPQPPAGGDGDYL